MDNKNDTLATTAPGGALTAMPDDLMHDAGRGTENIGAEDVRPPRLRICQAGSPQRKPDNEKQIAGLQELDMFNDLSGEIYGRGPLNFVVVQSLGARGMLFAGDGKTVLDFDVPLDDKRMQFTTDSTGHRVKPVASKFYDYLIWLPVQSELLALSCGSTLITAAIKLNGLLKLPLKLDGQLLVNPPSWARTYALETKMKQDANYAWGIFNLRTIGVTDHDVRATARMLSDVYGKKRVIMGDETDAAEEHVSRDPNTVDADTRDEREEPTDM